MKKTIAFLPRNQFHINLFIKVGACLNEIHNCNVVFVRELEKNNCLGVFEFEKEVEKIFHAVDISSKSLEKIQNKYPDADFMRAIYSEREFNFFPEYFSYQHVSYDFQMRYLVSCVMVFESWLDGNNISAVVSELLTGLPDSILFEVCKARNVKYISIRSSKMTPGMIVCDKYYDEPEGMLDIYERFINDGVPPEILEKAKKHIYSIRNEAGTPAYMQLTKKRFKLFTFQRAKTFLRRIGVEKIPTNSISLYQHPVLNPARWALHRFNNIRKTRKSFAKWFQTEIPAEEKYFIYPLHYEPEASTLIRAFHFSDQMCVINQVIKVLPLGVKLVVKEHGGNQGYRKSDFYRKLYYLPNVILVPPSYDGKKLIKNSVGVITLTGRMGWESLIMNKPVIAFGETFWTSFEKVRKPESWGQLKEFVRSIVENASKEESQVMGKDDVDDGLISYAAAYISLVHEANFVLGTKDLYDDVNVKRIAEMLYNEVLDS